MVLGLLTLAAIPTTIGVAEGISSTKKKEDENEGEEDPTVASTTEAQRMRKFHLQCYCDGPSSAAASITGGQVILRDDKLWILPPHTTPTPPSSSPFLGFYVPYPDPARHPSPLGLVSFVPSAPPMLNWIYVLLPTRELRYGNRTASIKHTVGPWAWDVGDDDASKGEGKCKDDNGGGLTLEGREGCVAVEVEEGGWQLFWEDEEGRIPGLEGKRRLQVSVERVFAEGVEDKGDEKDRVKERERGKVE